MCRFRDFLIAVPLLFGCAHQVPPTGGPVDKTPPRIIQTSPAPDSVNVPLNAAVEFTFSEGIDRDTFPGALFLVPAVRGQIEYKYGRRKVRLTFSNGLLADRTYVVTLGTDLKDNHGVPMAQSFTFAFSTGDSLDYGEIAGKVYDDKPQGILLWAYILPDSSDDERIEPRKRGGDYITQAGEDGRFRLPNLAAGRYRVIAVRDAGKNGVYDPVEDQIGLPFRDILLRGKRDRFGGLTFRMTRADTMQPKLSDVRMPSGQIIEFRFDEAVQIADSSWKNHFNIFAKGSAAPVTLIDAGQYPLDPKLVTLVTEKLDSAATYVAEVAGVTDLAGNALDSASARYEFKGNASADTLRPRIVKLAPPDSSRNIPLDAPIAITFNEWMRHPQLPGEGEGFTVVGAGGDTIPGTARWVNPFEVHFVAASGWKSGERAAAKIDPLQFKDLAGNALFDTSGARVFWAINQDTLASIAGTITANDSSITAPIAMMARQVDRAQPGYQIWLDGFGAYRFENILPGIYLIDGYFDANRNKKYDFGLLDPYKPAEFFFVSDDSIAVRSRWPNEGNDIRLLVK